MSDNIVIPIIAIGGSLALAFFGMLFHMLRSVSRTNEIEQSRREVAAYVAEGTITADEAERLLDAGPKHDKSCRS